jgi:hypothetical protein
MNGALTASPVPARHVEATGGQETQAPRCGVGRPAHSAISATFQGQYWVRAFRPGRSGDSELSRLGDFLMPRGRRTVPRHRRRL